MEINIFGVIKQIIRIFISPLFFNIFKLEKIYLLTAIDSFFCFLLLPILIYGIYILIRKKEIEIIKLCFIPILIHAIALGNQYDSSSIRQSITIYPLVLFLYIYSIYEIKNRINKKIKKERIQK